MLSEYVLDALDAKLNEVFDGKVVRKDLLHRIKKGTNVPTFVLEFLLARYCASNDPAEIQEGMEAVLSTLQENYVRPDEANAAQSRVAMKGKHKFIDKVHVRYVEKEKRHWASLENFASQRIAIGEKFYRDNDRLLEGGIWAEVVIAHNDIDADAYAFYVEDLRPIQLSRFDFSTYGEAKKAFTRDEWMDVILRSFPLYSTSGTAEPFPFLVLEAQNASCRSVFASVPLLPCNASNRAWEEAFRRWISEVHFSAKEQRTKSSGACLAELPKLTSTAPKQGMGPSA